MLNPLMNAACVNATAMAAIARRPSNAGKWKPLVVSASVFTARRGGRFGHDEFDGPRAKRAQRVERRRERARRGTHSTVSLVAGNGSSRRLT